MENKDRTITIDKKKFDLLRRKLMQEIGAITDRFEERLVDSASDEIVEVRSKEKLRELFDRLKGGELRGAVSKFSKLLLDPNWLPEQAKSTQVDADDSSESPRSCSILIIEDDTNVLRMLKTMLETVGHKVTGFDNGRQGVIWASKNRPDLILMDAMLPGVDGIQLTKRFKENPAFRKIPIIIMTGYSTRAIVQDSIKAGANGFVTKPVQYDVLIEKVSELIEKHGIQNPKSK